MDREARDRLRALCNEIEDLSGNDLWETAISVAGSVRILLAAMDAADARAEKAEAALARERRVSEALIPLVTVAWCPPVVQCPAIDDKAKDCEACVRSWAESEADKEVPHE